MARNITNTQEIDEDVLRFTDAIITATNTNIQNLTHDNKLPNQITAEIKLRNKYRSNIKELTAEKKDSNNKLT